MQVLEKAYILEPEDDVIPKRFTGTEIKWKDPSLNPTVEMVSSTGPVRRWVAMGRVLRAWRWGEG
jgi:hypothetical protein